MGVVSRHLVALGVGGIVEDVGQEKVETTLQADHRLPNVYEFGGIRSDDVYAKKLACLAVEDQFQKSVRRLCDLSRAISLYRATPIS